MRNPAKSIKVGRAGKPIKPNKNAQTTHYEQDGGGGGIRTHGTLRPSGFQDRRNRPLYHPSGNNGSRKGLMGMECFSRRNEWGSELGMHSTVMLGVDRVIAKSEAGRQAGCWPLLRGAHESRRGGMVDATDLKSVEGQPSWGFESPRRHMDVQSITDAGDGLNPSRKKKPTPQSVSNQTKSPTG